MKLSIPTRTKIKYLLVNEDLPSLYGDLIQCITMSNTEMEEKKAIPIETLKNFLSSAMSEKGFHLEIANSVIIFKLDWETNNYVSRCGDIHIVSTQERLIEKLFKQIFIAQRLDTLYSGYGGLPLYELQKVIEFEGVMLKERIQSNLTLVKEKGYLRVDNIIFSLGADYEED